MRLQISSIAAATALSIVGFAAFASADPFAGTIGTEFTVTFDQDVGSKPKIVLTYEGPGEGAKAPKSPRAKAKLISSTGTSATFVIQSAKGGGEFRIGAAKSDADGGTLLLAAPGIDGYSTLTVASGGELQIFGGFFGELANKRNAPKVYVGGKKARVTSFADSQLTIQLSKKTPAGVQDIRIVNKVGETTDAGAVTVTTPPPAIKGGDSLFAKVNGKNLSVKFTKKTPEAAVAAFNGPAGTLQITAIKNSGNPAKKLTIQQFNVLFQTGVNDLANLQLPATFNSLGLVLYQQSQTVIKNFQPTVTSTIWSNESGGAFTLTIGAFDGERFSGTFSGTLPRKTGEGAAQAEFTSGKFVLTLAE